MGLKQIIANKTKSCAVASPSTRNAQLLDDLSQNTRNSQCNTSATTHIKPLENKDSIRNLPRNHDATVQKTDAQLSPLKMPQKLRSENSELRGDLPTLSVIGGGDNSVISANNLSNDEANDLALKSEVKPVIQETVRQLEEVSTNGESLRPTTDNLASEMQEVFPSSTHYPKSAVEKSYPHIEDGQLSSMEEVNATFGVRYTHLIKCQQCEHLTSTGYCRVKPRVKPMPEAMRDCVSFEMVQVNRSSEVRREHYSTMELNDLLGRYEKPLFHHLVNGCASCSFMDSRYCVDAFAIGSSYDALLMAFEDAASKREALLNAVIRARISGRKVFVSLDHDKVPPPPNTAFQTRKCGIGDSERPFVNHIMACQQCKPANRTYCDEGLKLKAKADSNSV